MITLLNGDTFLPAEIKALAYSDDFYYNYLGKHALSSSMLRNIFDSPNRQLEYLKKEDKETDALIIGKLVHWCFLEPDVFYKKIFVDTPRTNTKEFKEAVEQHGAQNVYKDKFRAIAEWICRKLDNNEVIRELRKKAEIEVPAVDMLGEYPVRGKADMIVGDTIYDLKTGISTPEEFAKWKINKMNYDLQCYMYLQLFKDAKHFKFIYINKQTRDIGLIHVPEEVIERGRIKYTMAVEAYKRIFQGKDLDEIEYSLDQYIYEDDAR